MSQERGKALCRWWKPSSSHVSMSGAVVETLASGAEVRPAVSHDNSPDGAPANGAEFTTFVSNLETEMGRARFAIGADIGVNAGAFAVDGCLKNSVEIVM